MRVWRHASKGWLVTTTFPPTHPPNQVNISASEREGIEKELVDPKQHEFRPDLFDEAQKQIFGMLKNDLCVGSGGGLDHRR